MEKAERERRVASVRFWEDGEGRLYTDIRLVSESPQLSRTRPGERPRLADYLEEA